MLFRTIFNEPKTVHFLTYKNHITVKQIKSICYLFLLVLAEAGDIGTGALDHELLSLNVAFNDRVLSSTTAFFLLNQLVIVDIVDRSNLNR